MGILEITTIIIFLIYPLGELVRVNILPNITIHPLDFFVFFLVTFFFVTNFKRSSRIFFGPVDKSLLSFAVITTISLIVNLYWLSPNQLLVSALYLIRLFFYMGVFFVIKNLSTQFVQKILMPLLFFNGLIILFTGFFQFIYYPSLIEMFKFGWDKHVYRLFSVFLDPNYAGAFLSLFLFLIYGLTYKNVLENQKTKSLILSFLSLFTIFAIFLTFSRSAILMSLVGSIVFFSLINKKKIILYFLLFLIIFVTISSPKFYIENMNLFRTYSSFQRIDSAKIAYNIFSKNIFFGVGFNTYRYALEKYGYRTKKDIAKSHADSGTDNSILFLATTSGIFGLISFVILLVNLKKSVMQKIKDKDYLSIVFISSLAGLILSSQFINSFFYTPILLWFWTLYAITQSKELS